MLVGFSGTVLGFLEVFGVFLKCHFAFWNSYGFFGFGFCSYYACASSYNAIVSMDRVDFTEGLWETFRSRSIFLAHDNAGSKFDKHPISIDFTGYKNTYKLIF